MTEVLDGEDQELDWYGVPHYTGRQLQRTATVQLEVLRDAVPVTAVALYSLNQHQDQSMQLVPLWPLNHQDSVYLAIQRRGEVRPGWELVLFTLQVNAFRIGPHQVPALVHMRPTPAPSALVHFPSQHVAPNRGTTADFSRVADDPESFANAVFSVAVTCAGIGPEL